MRQIVAPDAQYDHNLFSVGSTQPEYVISYIK